MCSRRAGAALFLCLHCCQRVADRKVIVYIMLYICKEQILFGDYILQKKKGKTAVTLRDSLDVNKEALAKVCK